MILAFELTWAGVTHAPVNAAMVRVMAAAFPGGAVRVHADPSHLAELGLAGVPGVELAPVARPAMHAGRTQIVSWARFRAELSIIRAALRAVPPGAPCLLVLLSATPTAIWAACLAARLRGDGTGVQAMLHGNLSDAVGWRPRNPLARRFDLAATLRGRLPAPVRYVVFEPHILPALARFSPRAAAAADVIPHPVSGEGPPDGEPSQAGAEGPVRIGFVGQGTRAKGFDAFLDVAGRLSARHPGRVAFQMLGSVPDDMLAAARAAPLEEPPGLEPLPRAEFAKRMARLHYVMLPFRPGYYDLSASGGLMDAVAWLKPLITTRVPLTEAFFAAHGDVGGMADGVDGLAKALDAVLAAGGAPRYAAQAAAMRRARAQRTPEALAAGYAAAVARLSACEASRRL